MVKLKKFRVFNESKDQDNLNIIREAFYSLTDAYPLNITVNVVETSIGTSFNNNIGWDDEFNYKIKIDYKNIKDLNHKEVENKINSIINYLKIDGFILGYTKYTYIEWLTINPIRFPHTIILERK